MSISLLENEKILKTTWPHPLSMVHLYFNWLYIICLGFFFIIMHTQIEAWIHELPMGQQFSSHIFFLFWSSCLLLPSLVVSFYYINWSWLFLSIMLSISGITIVYKQGEVANFVQYFTDNFTIVKDISYFIVDFLPLPITTEQFFSNQCLPHHLLIIVGFFGLISSNSYRRAHRYYLTNKRIIARFGFINIRERDIIYSKVDDLIVQQGLLGRIFRFGTLIPISASGMGTGSDHVFAAVGLEGKLPMGPTMSVTIGGGRTITIPRAPSFYSLYGVPHPEEVKTIMLKEMQKREYGHTKRQRLEEIQNSEDTFM